MKLYLISQEDKDGYESYDSAVVAAPDEETARNTDPSDGMQMTEEDWNRKYSSWCSDIDYVTVKYLGEAAEDIEQGVIVASYNAG